MAWKAKPGGMVKYRMASGRVRNAIIVSVVSQSILNLRVGNGATKLVANNANKVNAHTTGAGWYK